MPLSTPVSVLVEKVTNSMGSIETAVTIACCVIAGVPIFCCVPLL